LAYSKVPSQQLREDNERTHKSVKQETVSAPRFENGALETRNRNEVFTLPACHAVLSGNWLPTIPNNLSALKRR